MRYLKKFGKHHIASAKLSVVFFYWIGKIKDFPYSIKPTANVPHKISTKFWRANKEADFDMNLYIWILKNVRFCSCLSVHIMYIIHNKATFMVNEIINPIIRKSRNSTIMTTSLLSKKSRFRGNTHTCLILTFYVNYYTIFLHIFQYKKQIKRLIFFSPKLLQR